MAPELPVIHSCRTCILFTAISAVVLLLVGCSDPETDLNERLCREIIQVHDEAMEQTGHLFDLQTQLEQTASNSPADPQMIETLIASLIEADRAMFSWMNQYQTLAVNDDISVDNAYRKEQLEAIRSIGRMTDQAISDAKQFLSSAGSNNGN